MKKARKIICIAIIAVAVVVLIMCNSINANAYEVKLSSNNSTVNSGDTFTVTMKFSDITSMMNAKLTYDPNLFLYKGHKEIPGLQVNESQKGTIAFLYYVDEGEGSLDSISFSFEAQTVSEEKSGAFTIGQDIAIVTNDKNLNYTNIQQGSIFECSVTVKPKKQVADKAPIITPSGDISLTVGETKKLTADKDVTWSSSDSSIVKVDENGNITGVKEGNAIITATDKVTGLKTNVTVTVHENGNPDNPNPSTGAPVITPGGDVNLKVGDSQQMTADQDVTWKSSDESVATVDSTGKITAVGKGTAIIIATNANGESTSFTVTVDDADSSNNNGNGNSNNDQNNGSNNGSNDGSNNGSNNGSNGSSSNGSSSNGSSSGGSSTGGTSTSTGNSSSTADAAVPATGESSVETIAILVIVTLIVGTIIFRRKSKIK